MPPPKDRTRFWAFAALLLLLLQAAVLGWRMDRPWTYNDDYNGAFWGQAARNLSRAGFAATAGVPAPLYFGAPPIPADDLYVHHPTLLADLVFLGRALLGGSEGAARALPIAFSLLTGLVLWLTVRAFAGPRRAVLTLALFIAAPMELHYGQMVNFEAPELFLLLSALACLCQWRNQSRKGGTFLSAAGFLCCLTLAMWLDWLGYLLALLLAGPMLFRGPRREKQLATALLTLAAFSGFGFLIQIHIANPNAWTELLHAFRERSGRGNLAGSTFTFAEWARTEWGYLTVLYHPAAWLLALAGAIGAVRAVAAGRSEERPLLHIGAIFFAMDAIYVCVLRNQSFIHDFAGFYFLIPIAIFGARLLEYILTRAAAAGSRAAYPAACALVAALTGWLLFSGIHRLANIDTQFCILDDDDTEPPLLMPDLGRLIKTTFPPDAPVLIDFDQYYSPLPYYAERPIANNLRTWSDWQAALADKTEPPSGGVVWLGAPDAAELTTHLPPGETRRVEVDGIPFCIWVRKN